MSDLSFQVYLSPARTISGDSTFSPVTSTLFMGDKDAVLVDAQYYRDDVAALSDMIQRSGRRLKTIYITHGHSDHYFGAGEIAKMFNARIIALPSVVEYIRSNNERDLDSMRQMFGDRAIAPTAFPEAMDGAIIEIEGRALRAIEIGQGDIPHSTALFSPDLGVVVPGDIVYNGIHMMLGITGPKEWENWIESIEAIAALKPRVIVAGHKRSDVRDDEPIRILATSMEYIRDFAEAVKVEPSTKSIVQSMQRKYPDFGNLPTLIYSASAASRAAKGQPRLPIGG